MYRADGVDGPQEMEKNEAVVRHSWARQHAWLLLTFFPFPMGHPANPPCTAKEEENRLAVSSEQKLTKYPRDHSRDSANERGGRP